MMMPDRKRRRGRGADEVSETVGRGAGFGWFLAVGSSMTFPVPSFLNDLSTKQSDIFPARG
jgi:hypothetical protein